MVPTLLWLSLLVTAPSNELGNTHRRVFATVEDVAQVRQAIASNVTWQVWADELVAAAEAYDLADLPPIDRSWWDEACDQPWSDTYPQVFHHTWVVPQRWARLAKDCAWSGALRPESGLRSKARTILLSLSEYTFEYEHYDVGMNYTVWVLEALEAYDLLYDDLSAQDRQRLDAFFQRYLTALMKNDGYWVEHEPGGGINNHYAWHKLGFLAIGLVYGQPELVDMALDGPKGIRFLMRYGFTDNGLWMEGSIPYQLAATTPLVKAAELLENAEHPAGLYRTEDGTGHTLKDAYDALIPLLFPDRTLPAIGDCYASRPHLGQRPDWEILYRRFQDPHYAWLLRDQPRRSRHALLLGQADLLPGEIPFQETRLWPEHGYAALRSVEGTDYWSGRGWSLFATYSSNRVHENQDKLSIMLFADGHLWLADREAKAGAEHSFSANVQKELNRHTLCHNALLVDQSNQRHPIKPLELIEFQSTPAMKRLTIGDLNGQLYPDVHQMRTCLVRDAYVLDFYQVASKQPHDLDWLLHIDGQSARQDADGLRDRSVQLPATIPWNYLKQPNLLGKARTFSEVFQRGEQQFRVDLFASHDVEAIGCGFPRDDSQHPDLSAMRIFRIPQESSAWYAAVYRTSATGFEQPLACRVEAGATGHWRVSIQLAERCLIHRVPRLPPLESDGVQ
jgi:hypothetical protein